MSQTQITVDLTGIQDGDTLQWSDGKFVVGEPLVASRVITTTDDLPVNPADGSRVTVSVGAHKEVLQFDAAAAGGDGQWIGEAEYILVTQGDTWAMDLGNRNASQLLDWSPVSNAVPYGKAFAIIAGPLDLDDGDFDTGDGVITVDTTTSPHSFPFTDESGTASMYLQIRDNYISHTGRTSTTLTGCTVVEGSRGTIPNDEWVTQTIPGGWGFNAATILYASDLFAAGLSLQERAIALMNSSPEGVSEHKIHVAPYWRQYNPGDGVEATSALPLAGGMGVSAEVVSLDGTGGEQGNGERTFYMTPNDWTDWPLAAPTKRLLVPQIVGKMAAGATITGSVLDYELAVRWVVPV